jgi:hypothetical protein
MTHAPDGTDQRPAGPAPMAGHNGGDGDDVVGIGRVPHPEKEAE